MQRALPHPIAVAVALGIAAAHCPASARADETDACIDASVKGQELRDAGKLLDARAKFLLCSREPCPGLLQRECAAWLANLDARLPSVVISAQDPDGHDTALVKVTLDQAPLLERLDGKAIPLDPGEHLLRFERPGSPPVEEKVVAREGEQRRVVAVRFERAKVVTPPPPPRQGVPASVWILGGAGLAFGGVFTALGVVARNDRDHLRATCAPGCAAADVNAVRDKEIVANVALGAGVASIAAAVIVLVTRYHDGAASGPKPRRADARPRPRPPVTMDLSPTQGGAVASVRGSFPR